MERILSQTKAMNCQGIMIWREHLFKLKGISAHPGLRDSFINIGFPLYLPIQLKVFNVSFSFSLLTILN
jgi:hypothetical protein